MKAADELQHPGNPRYPVWMLRLRARKGLARSRRQRRGHRRPRALPPEKRTERINPGTGSENPSPERLRLREARWEVWRGTPPFQRPRLPLPASPSSREALRKTRETTRVALGQGEGRASGRDARVEGAWPVGACAGFRFETPPRKPTWGVSALLRFLMCVQIRGQPQRWRETLF